MVKPCIQVSTHSRPKAAGIDGGVVKISTGVSTHSRLKAAGDDVVDMSDPYMVSTHSRLKAAGLLSQVMKCQAPCFNTQPPEGGWLTTLIPAENQPLFQHTAA